MGGCLNREIVGGRPAGPVRIGGQLRHTDAPGGVLVSSSSGGRQCPEYVTVRAHRSICEPCNGEVSPGITHVDHGSPSTPDTVHDDLQQCLQAAPAEEPSVTMAIQ